MIRPLDLLNSLQEIQELEEQFNTIVMQSWILLMQ